MVYFTFEFFYEHFYFNIRYRYFVACFWEISEHWQVLESWHWKNFLFPCLLPFCVRVMLTRQACAFFYKAWGYNLVILFLFFTVHFLTVHWNADRHISSWILDKSNEGTPAVTLILMFTDFLLVKKITYPPLIVLLCLFVSNLL